jgi:hypothetical protein
MKTTAEKPSVLSLAQKAALIYRLLDHIACECKEVDTEKDYDEMLDQSYDLSSVGGPFSGMSASRVLREVDPTAYRCGFSDWLDSEDYTEIDGIYYRDGDIDEARESFVADLQTELDEAQTGLEVENNLEEGEERNEETVAELTETIARLEAEIELASSHSF